MWKVLKAIVSVVALAGSVSVLSTPEAYADSADRGAYARMIVSPTESPTEPPTESPSESVTCASSDTDAAPAGGDTVALRWPS